MKIAPREQFILTVVASVVVIAALFALLIYPTFKKLGTLDTQIVQARSEVAATKSLLEQRQAIKDRAAQTDVKWLALANQIPDNPDLPALIIELQDAAFESGVQLIAATPSEVVNKGTFASVPISIQVIGTWADTVDYLQRIAKLSRGMRTVGFASAVSDNSAQATRQNAELPDYFVATALNLEAYMIPASSGATPTAAVPAPAGQ